MSATRIAMVGGAPESKYIAPYGDNSWEIWATSMCHTAQIPRCNAFFEIHSLSPLMQDHTYTLYLAWLRTLPRIYCFETHPKFPNGMLLPWEEMFRRFKPHFFTSSLAYMMALAIMRDPKPEWVGFWGFDMMGSDEYKDQRPAVHHFADIMDREGIKLWVPPESEMLVPSPPYGWKEYSREWRKRESRLTKLREDWDVNRKNQATLREAEIAIGGAVQQMEYDHFLTYELGSTGGFEISDPNLVPVRPVVSQGPTPPPKVPLEEGPTGQAQPAAAGG